MYRRSTMGASGITDDMPVTESVDRLPAAGSTPVFVFEGDDLRWHGIGWQDKPSSGGGPPRGGGRVSARLAPKPVIVCWIGIAWKRLPSPVSELGAVLFGLAAGFSCDRALERHDLDADSQSEPHIRQLLVWRRRDLRARNGWVVGET